MTADLRALIDERLDGQYLVERELGRGGMGIVYLARERRLDRLVASITAQSVFGGAPLLPWISPSGSPGPSAGGS